MDEDDKEEDKLSVVLLVEKRFRLDGLEEAVVVVVTIVDDELTPLDSEVIEVIDEVEVLLFLRGDP